MNHDLELLTAPGSDGEYMKSLPEPLPTKRAGGCDVKNTEPTRKYQLLEKLFWLSFSYSADIDLEVITVVMGQLHGTMLFKHCSSL